MTHNKDWWKVAVREGRVCRMCNQPVNKADWKCKIYDHLCPWCWQREDALPHNSSFRLGR